MTRSETGGHQPGAIVPAVSKYYLARRIPGKRLALLWPPIVESVDHTGRNIEAYSASACNLMRAWVDLRSLPNRMLPNLSIDLDGTAVSTIVIINGEIGLSIFGWRPRATQVAMPTSRNTHDHEYRSYPLDRPCHASRLTLPRPPITIRRPWKPSKTS